MSTESKQPVFSKIQKSHEHSHCCGHDHSHEAVETPKESLKARHDEVLTSFKVMNMDCADEIRAISDALKLEGIIKIQANLMSSTVEVIHTQAVDKELIKKRIETTVVKVIASDESAPKNPNLKRILIVAASGVFLTIGLALHWTIKNDLVEGVLFFLSILFGGSLVFPKAWGALKRGALDMNVLMTLAVIGAIAIQEYSEAAAVVFLFSLSELLESLSVQRARRAIGELLKITPQKAQRIHADGTTSEIDVNTVALGELIRVKAGEVIPVDGVVKKGSSSVNQAPLTGESVPVLKVEGENVYAGTINQEGTLDIRVSKAFSDTKISQVIKLVEEAQSQRAVSQKFVDRFAEIYTPVVMILALLTFLIPPLMFGGVWSDWLYKALVLLVIACPCALVISTPVSIVSSLTALARRGVLVKGGAILEVLGKMKALAVDKTGTLTEGKLTVEEVILFGQFTKEDTLKIAKALESHSTHPIARAVVDMAHNLNIQTLAVDRFVNVSGRGVEGIIEGHTYLLGNHRFAHDVGICTPALEETLKQLEEKSLSVVVVGHKPHGSCQGEIMGVIALGDKVRAETKDALLNLKAIGLERLVLLSGDNQKTVSAIAQTLPLDEAYGDLLPEDKVKHIEKLNQTYKTVGMIGDGINDAPAMAKSSLGIAMGFVGSDTAIETADVTLMTDDLKQVAVAIESGRRTLQVIKFNIAFALITKLIFFVLTFMGYSHLWLAVAADTGAALLVILNSLRLLRL